MAKRTKIKASFGRLIDLKAINGKFENMRLEAEVEFELEPGDNPEAVYNEAFKDVFTQVNTKANLILENAKKNANNG